VIVYKELLILYGNRKIRLYIHSLTIIVDVFSRLHIHHNETIKHLFFQCRFVRSIWSIIQVASKLYSPTSVTNIFGNWLYGIDLRFRMLIRVGALAVVLSLWLYRNDFNDKNCSLLQTDVYSPFVVAFAAYGESRPFYGGL
jgi:hypothetical protein